MTTVGPESYPSATDGSYTVFGEPLTGKSCLGGQHGSWDNDHFTYCRPGSSHGFYFTEPINPTGSNPYIRIEFDSWPSTYDVFTVDYEGNDIAPCSGYSTQEGSDQLYDVSTCDFSAGPTPPPVTYDYTACTGTLAAPPCHHSRLV